MAPATAGEEITWTIGASSGDVEIDAMRQILVALRPLDPDERQRVLRWAVDRENPVTTVQLTESRA